MFKNIRKYKFLVILMVLLTFLAVSGCTTSTWVTYNYKGEWEVKYPLGYSIEVESGIGTEAVGYEYAVHFECPSSHYWLEVSKGMQTQPLPKYASWNMACRDVIITDDGWYELEVLDFSVVQKEIEDLKQGIDTEPYWIVGHPDKKIQAIYDIFSSSFKILGPKK